jgi:hypothetical protein
MEREENSTLYEEDTEVLTGFNVIFVLSSSAAVLRTCKYPE